MKKWLALLLAAALVLMSTAAVAEIGTADAPVPVSILIKDVSPDGRRYHRRGGRN